MGGIRVVAVILALLSVWFAYDGWINSAPDMVEHQTFNRIGTPLLLLPAAIV
jgi:hypothetical protein